MPYSETRDLLFKMAADQRKKRLNSVNIVDCTSRELCKVKRKKSESLQYTSKMRCNISLEWNEKKKSVVARREQIGISRRDLIPLIDPPQGRNILADVFDVPCEIYDLKCLTEVLSFKVWQTCFSDNERSFLSQLLPKGKEADEVVEELLAGENFHFGNPFLKWCSSLCSGDLHPDNILHQEEYLKENKKAYYSELQKYHTDVIGDLQMWKERCLSCKNPEKEIVQRMLRSPNHAEKIFAIQPNGSKLHEPDEHATSESGSWATDERVSAGDHSSLLFLQGASKKGKGVKLHKHVMDEKKGLAKPKKGEKLLKQNNQSSDGAQFMSYIKVSKEQHKRVKSLIKNTSNSIQHKSLNTVLGNLHNLHVQPFEKYEEEEEQKLHEHWLQLVNSCLPAGFANWRRISSQKRQMVKLLCEELEEKLHFVNEPEETEHSLSVLQEHMSVGVAYNECSGGVAEDKEEETCGLLKEQLIVETTSHTSIIPFEDEERDEPINDLSEQTESEQTSTPEENDELVSTSTHNEFMQEIGSLGDNQELHDMDMAPNGNVTIAMTDNIPSLPECSKNVNGVDISSNEGKPLSSSNNVWTEVNIPVSYYQPSSTPDEYATSNALSLGHSRVIQQPDAGLINLESGMPEKDGGKDLLHRQNNNSPFFSSYPNQDRNEPFQSYMKDQGNLHYQPERKQTGLEFQAAPDVITGAGQFSGHYRDQLYSSVPLELRQKRANNLYMSRNIEENIFSDGVRYSVPRGQQFSPVNVHDWDTNSVRMSGPPAVPSVQSHLNNGELLSQSWFPVEHQSRGGWSNVEGAGPNQGIINGSNSDQSLFSVISECSQLRSRAPFDAVGSGEQLIQLGNYGVLGGSIPTGSSVLQQTAHQLDYLSARDASDGLKNSSIGWMGLPHHNASFQDSTNKSFLRSWNR